MPNQLQVTLSDEIAAGELVIYAENDADIYRRHYLPVALNLQKHFKRGEFDLGGPHMRLSVTGSCQPPSATTCNCDRQQRWFQVFDKPTRQMAAEMEAKSLLTEFELGNFFDA